MYVADVADNSNGGIIIANQKEKSSTRNPLIFFVQGVQTVARKEMNMFLKGNCIFSPGIFMISS